ncbi:MAG: hypothetical protein JNL74_03985, partial [Fibrobacteres bacterium]|nr:hypothetical protein [Fibrobacterota bacterium]
SNDNKGSRRVSNSYQPSSNYQEDRETDQKTEDSPSLFSVIADIIHVAAEINRESEPRKREQAYEREEYQDHKEYEEIASSYYNSKNDPAIRSVKMSIIDTSGKSTTYDIIKNIPENLPRKFNTQSGQLTANKPVYDYESDEDDSRDGYGGWTIKETNTKGYVGFRLTNGLLYSKDIGGLTNFSIVFANHYASKKRWSIDVGLGYSPMNLESELSKSIDGFYEGHAAFQHRWYSTPDYTWMGLYFLIGADLRFIAWGYNNPITTDVYNEWDEYVRTDIISSDGLTGFNLQTGFGWSFLQTKYAKFSAEVSANASVYGFDTWEGFTNDLFPASGHINLTLEAVFGGQRKMEIE